MAAELALSRRLPASREREDTVTRRVATPALLTLEINVDRGPESGPRIEISGEDAGKAVPTSEEDTATPENIPDETGVVKARTRVELPRSDAR